VAPMDVLVLGAGTMGRGIAHCFARGGFLTGLFDPEPGALKNALKTIEEDLQLFVDLGRMSRDRKQKILGMIQTTGEFPDEVPDIVVEAVPEELLLKQALFRNLENRTGPDRLFCTNTSAISIDQLAECLDHPERFVGTHFWNPAHVVPLVEVIPCSAASEEAVGRIVSVLRRIGQRPVRINRDIPGFVGNRLQHALQREALALVENGVVSAGDLDEIVRYSFGLRMPLMGPFERADLGGLDVTLRVHEYLLPYLDRRTEPARLLRNLVDDGRWGLKKGRGFFSWKPELAQKRTRDRDIALLKILDIMSANEQSSGERSKG
jgi:3-hydroxybutyryl-CoA dehydrogenase